MATRTVRFLAAALALASVLGVAPTPSRAGPKAIEDPAWLREKLREVLEKYELPAVAASLVVDGEVVAASAVGVRKLGTKTPVSRDDPFLTCSLTKPMTATLIGRLVDEGVLRWDLTLLEGLPALRYVMKAPYRRVDLSQLLAHVSGMPGQPTRADPDTPATAEQEVARRRVYATLAVLDDPVAPPGVRAVYGGGSILAAAVAERATGDAYEQLMRTRLFEPLGMTTAGFGPMASSPAEVDAPWEHATIDGKLVPYAPDDADRWHIRAPAGNVHCSVIDLARFAAVHVRGARGETGFLRAETIRRLHTPVAAGSPPGFARSPVAWSQGEVLWHNGSNGRNTAVLNIAPAEGFATCVMTNAGGQARHGEALGEIHRFLVARAKR
jgi:CubicO group peptidase (beta-lactamase class C family)